MRGFWIAGWIVVVAGLIGCGAGNEAEGITTNSQGIINGTEDAERFPEVCTITWHDPADSSNARFSLCSGVLVSPTVLLSAGHCAFVEVWGIYENPMVSCSPVFESGVSPEVSGHFEIIPGMDPDLGVWDPDVSVFLLNEPVSLQRYGMLPAPGQVGEIYGAMLPGRGPAMTSVGYGMTDTEGTGTRRFTKMRFYGIDDLFLWGTPNPGRPWAGDSGGPAYLANSKLILGITVLGIDDLTGLGRMDRADVQSFVRGYLQ